MNSAKKKLKLGLWVSLFCLALPFYSIAQEQTTIRVKKNEHTPMELSLSWSIYNNDVLNRGLISEDLKIVCENKSIDITQFKLYVYENKNLIELLTIQGNTLSKEAIEILKRVRTNDPIAISVISAKGNSNKPIAYRFPTFFFFVK